jgi:hypothetical protein
MRIEKAVLRQLSLPFKKPFRTSFGELKVKDFLLLELVGAEGFRAGENAPPSPAPGTTRKRRKGRAMCSAPF